ncbi:MAG: sigma-54-dependent Fis family transcriptional regulator [Phycisphaerales bacterium]|nr:MAG: sigma-54-dependent Fis family transcriptional regulator [Phycisphaerales bacterium]
MSRILVVDDKEMMRDSVATTLSRKGHAVVTASSGKDAIDKLSKRSVDVVVTDLQMPEMDGLDLLATIRDQDEQLPVVLMTAYGTIETAVQAMKNGAYDYITKPFSGDVLLVTIARAINHAKLVRENAILRLSGTPGTEAVSETAEGAAEDSHNGRSRRKVRAHKMIGRGRIMSELRERIDRIADSHGTVLITGESGAGKEVAARAIHESSPRAAQPFLAINCAALSTNLLESELFGHEKGAFTGADKLRKGRFELADGGTLLLDEISEIAPEIQAKLLRVLQEQCFERVGSSTSRSVDVRVIATTNRDLSREVERGTFRQDLYFRLNVLPLPMPALREHVEDIPELVQHFLEQVAKREGKPVKRVTPDAMELFQRYSWPGNVRELQNLCERAAVLTAGETIEAPLVAPWLPAADPILATSTEIAPSTVNGQARPIAARASSMMELNDAPQIDGAEGHEIGHICNGELTLDDIERETIIATLEHHNGHRQKSAEALGIGVRTLGLKLKKWKEARLVDESL